MKDKGARITKNNPAKEQSHKTHAIFSHYDFKTCCKATSIQIMWYQRKVIQINQWNTIENSQIDTHTDIVN